MKMVHIQGNDYTYKFPAWVIAYQYACYYADVECRNGDNWRKCFEEEYDSIIDDEENLCEWFLNNMDVEDIPESLIELVSSPKEKAVSHVLDKVMETKEIVYEFEFYLVDDETDD